MKLSIDIELCVYLKDAMPQIFELFRDLIRCPAASKHGSKRAYTHADRETSTFVRIGRRIAVKSRKMWTCGFNLQKHIPIELLCDHALLVVGQ